MPETGQTAIKHRTLDAIVNHTERLDAVYKSDLEFGNQVVTSRIMDYQVIRCREDSIH